MLQPVDLPPSHIKRAFSEDLPELPVSLVGWPRLLWPLLVLLALDSSLAVMVAAWTGVAITPVALTAAVCILLTGMLPAFVRPSSATNLFGCFAVLLAGVLLFTPSGDQTPTRAFPGESVLGYLPAMALFRLCNGVFLAPLVLHITTRYPCPGRLSGWQLAGCYAAMLLLLPVALFAPLVPLRAVAMLVLSLLWLGMLIAAGAQLVSASRGQPGQRHAAQQARLLLLSVVLSLPPLLLRPLVRGWEGNLLYDLLLASPIILPVGITYSILQHDLFGIDSVLRRALGYTTVSITMLAAYFGMTAVMTNLLIRVPLPFRELAILAGLLAAALAFAPLQDSAQRLINHAFYPERRAFRAALQAARELLSEVIQREAVTNLLTNDLPGQFKASWAVLTLGATQDSTPPNTKGALYLPLLVGGRLLGCYWLGPRRSGLAYSADEQTELQALIQQAALALAYGEAFEELSLLNHDLEERIAMRTSHLLAQQRALVGIEERQRLARDLHDSVKQTLFSLGLGLRASRGMLQHDPAGAVRMLQLQEELAIQAQSEMGTLLTQLRTPRYRNCDLVGPLAQLCVELGQQQQLAVALQAPISLELPQSLVNELRHIVKEALHNVIKHSQVRTAQLNVAVHGSWLELMVVDHGCGFDQRQPPREGSYGICGMRERAELIGGKLEIRSSEQEGTTVWVRVPLE